MIVDLEGTMHSNQTGKFPQVSNRGMQYVMVFYSYDANYIQGIPTKNRSAGELKRAYAEAYEMMRPRRYKPKLHKLNNETSCELKAWIEKEQTTMQYTPPDMHRTNTAKKAIQTWKNRFLEGLASLPANFPINFWCNLIQQANIMLILLWLCQINPAL
eukprot:325024-Ditylum_brightwellii.AAC.1